MKTRLILLGVLLFVTSCGSGEDCSTYSYEECRMVTSTDQECRTVKEEYCVDTDPYIYYYGPWYPVCGYC